MDPNSAPAVAVDIPHEIREPSQTQVEVTDRSTHIRNCCNPFVIFFLQCFTLIFCLTIINMISAGLGKIDWNQNSGQAIMTILNIVSTNVVILFILLPKVLSWINQIYHV